MADAEPDPHVWAMDLGPVYQGGPDMPIGAHLIVRRYDGGFRGEVRVAACGREFTKGTHPWGWWSTRQGNLPLQEHAVHCGQELMLAEFGVGARENTEEDDGA